MLMSGSLRCCITGTRSKFVAQMRHLSIIQTPTEGFFFYCWHGIAERGPTSPHVHKTDMRFILIARFFSTVIIKYTGDAVCILKSWQWGFKLIHCTITYCKLVCDWYFFYFKYIKTTNQLLQGYLPCVRTAITVANIICKTLQLWQ